MRPISLFLIALATVGAALCQSQVTPVVAKQRIVRDVWDPQGKLIGHTETSGRYLRNSSGSTVTQEYSSEEGKMVIRSGQMEDYSRHKIYALSYERHEAVERGDLLDGPHPEYLANASQALGEETVNGLPCLIHGIYETIDGKKRLIGKAYDSAEYGLEIKDDAMIETRGGARTHRVIELYDVQFVEPDPKEFALERFSFLEKGRAACNKPDAPASLESLK